MTTPMDEFQERLVIPVVNYSEGKAEVFHSAGVQQAGASKLLLGDGVLASAAPPTYFPMVKMGAHEYADGGLVANAPDMAALVSALRLQKTPLTRCYMLSLGTASRKDGIVLRDTPDAPGTWRAMRTRKLVQTIMSAQESLALTQVEALLTDRHHRVDREPDDAQAKVIRSLDNASPEAFRSLTYLAAEAFKAERPEHNGALREFFVH